MAKQETEQSILYGVFPVLEALEAGTELERIYIQNGSKRDKMKEIEQKARERGVAVNHVPVFKLNKLVRRNQNHQGVVAFQSLIQYQNLEHVLDEAFAKGKDPLILILDRVTDVRNIGAIARSANALGVDALLIPAKGGALLNEDAMKSSAGALQHIPVCRVRFIIESIQYLKQMGVQVVSCTEKSDQLLESVDFKQPTAIIMGSEEDGISPKYLDASDVKAKIPMVGDVGSFNVSVSAGIVLYECERQRG